MPTKRARGTERNVGSVTLVQLAYAVAIDTHRHFGDAAAACRVSQPTLSMQLRKLETALGVTLFDRTRSPVVPTDAGVPILAQARSVLREASTLGDIVTRDDGGVSGELRLGVIPTLAPYLLPRVVRGLAERHPRLQLVLEEHVTDDVVSRVRRGALDAGLVASPIGAADLMEQHLFTEPFVAYVSDRHPLSSAANIRASDLMLDDLWLLSDGHCLRLQAVALCRRQGARRTGRARSATPRTRFESGNLETLKRLVEQHGGMTLLPELAALEIELEAQRRLLKPFADPIPSRDVRLVRRREQSKPQLIDAMIALVLASLPPALRAR